MSYEIRVVRTSNISGEDLRPILESVGLTGKKVDRIVQKEVRTITLVELRERKVREINSEVVSTGYSVMKPGDNFTKKAAVVAFRRALNNIPRKDRVKLWEKFFEQFPKLKN